MFRFNSTGLSIHITLDFSRDMDAKGSHRIYIKKIGPFGYYKKFKMSYNVLNVLYQAVLRVSEEMREKIQVNGNRIFLGARTCPV